MKKSWIYIDGKAVEKQFFTPEHHHVMPDIQPYKSMVDGSMISSRSKHREHLREHNCFEVGNESMESKPVQLQDTRRKVLREQLANMTHSQANKILSKLRDDNRFTRR